MAEDEVHESPQPQPHDTSPPHEREQPVYVISVVARMLTMHQQTLRKYEREGFLTPHRTSGRVRLYSPADVRRLRHVQRLVKAGMNLAGITLAIRLSHRLDEIEYALRRGDGEAIAAILMAARAELGDTNEPH